MGNFDLKQYLIENKLTYQETMKEKAKKLKEEKIPFFHTQQILKLQDLSKTLPQQEAELKVGLNVLPKQAYRNEKDINSAIGKITKIEGDEVTVKKNNGAEEKRKKSDLIHIIDFTSEIVKKDKTSKLNELSMNPDEDLKKMIKLMGYDDLEDYFYDTTNGAAKAQLDFIMSKPTTKNLLHMKGIDPTEWTTLNSKLTENNKQPKVGDKVDVRNPKGKYSRESWWGPDEYLYNADVIKVNGPKITVKDINDDEYEVDVYDVDVLV